MRSIRAQRGITLVVSLIMLVVLTLIVVSAVRFGNVNLRIAGNAQAEVEAMAAAQLALDRAVAEIDAAANITDLVAKNNVTYSSGGATYQVSVTQPTCLLTTTIKNEDLNWETNPADQYCYDTPQGLGILDASGNQIQVSLSCKDQTWEVQASIVDDAKSGVSVSVAQGVAVRVGAAVTCP